MIFTGPTEVIRQAQVCDEELSRYERDLETMKGCCLYCRVEGKSFEHVVTACARRFNWIRAKQKALRDCQSKKKEWMDPHAVCWKCYQPQEIWRAADLEYEGDKSCQYPDMVMPLWKKAPKTYINISNLNLPCSTKMRTRHYLRSAIPQS
jgi:hypothetical protein